MRTLHLVFCLFVPIPFYIHLTLLGVPMLPIIPVVQLELGKELEERMAADRAANARTPQLLTLNLNTAGAEASVSRSCALRRPTAAAIADDALALVRTPLPQPSTLSMQMLR